MIEIAPDTAFLAYIGVTLAILFATWIHHLYRSSKRKLTPEEFDLTTCEYCHFAYLGTKGDKLSRCPQCKSLNRLTK